MRSVVTQAFRAHFFDKGYFEVCINPTKLRNFPFKYALFDMFYIKDKIGNSDCR